MAGRGDRDKAVGEERLLAHTRPLEIAAEDGDVDHPLRQEIERPVGGIGHGLELQVGELLAGVGVEVRVPGHDAEVRLAEADHRADPGLRDLHRVGLGARQIGDQAPRGQQQALARGGQHQALLLAQEELRVEPPLRLAQAVAEGRLREPQQRGRLRHRGRVGHRDQHGEVAHFQAGRHG